MVTGQPLSGGPVTFGRGDQSRHAWRVPGRSRPRMATTHEPPRPLPHFRRLTDPEPEAAPPIAYRAPRPRRLAFYRGAIWTALACAALIALTWIAPTEALRSVRDGASWLLARTDERGQAAVTVVLVAFAALAFAAAWGRATHPRRAVRLSDGRARMAVDEIAGALRDALEGRADTRAVEVRVENRGRHGLRLYAWLRVTRDARIDEVLEAVDAEAAALLRRLGLPLAELPLVDVRYDELDLRAGRLRD